MIRAIARLLRARRAELGLSQEEVSSRLGISRPMLSRWEAGIAVPTPERLEGIARALDLPIDPLVVAGGARVARLPSRSHRSTGARRLRAPYPLGATVEQMRRAGGCAESVYQDAMDANQQDCLRLATDFPCDTRWEMLATFHCVLHGSRIVMCAPGRYPCAALILDDFEWMYGGDQKQPALYWRGRDEWLLMFAQVRVRGGVRWAYRLDFLIYYKRKGRPGQWIFYELDGHEHDSTPNQDAERAEGIPLPELRHDNAKTLRHDYFDRLLADIREKAREGERMKRDRRRKARDRRRDREERAERRRAQP